MLLHFLSVSLGVLTILVLVQAQDQSGFISLDCGLPEHLSYSEVKTGINYISDAKFIDTDTDTSQGTPFISAIELRPLNDIAYDTKSPKSVLSLVERRELGSGSNSGYRYKDDVYDRIWLSSSIRSDWRRLNTSVNNDDLQQNHYKLPAIVMSTAVTPVNGSAAIQFYWSTDDVNNQYYLYTHFVEVEKLAANETRAFNINVNGGLFYAPVIPLYRKAMTIFNNRPLTGATVMEVFSMHLNWQGDPCAPVNYVWEGLNCSVDGNNISRITSLDLSSSGLIGQIASSISKLTMLQYLDLSNNGLNGSLPDFLIQLHSLKVLNVRKNKLTGSVPRELIERSKTGSLSLSVDDNPGLCTTKSCGKKSLFVPLIASFSALIIVILFISLGFRIFRRHKAAVTSTNSKQRGSLISKQQAFSYTSILNITDNFKTIIGEGGFGKVYLGTLQNQTQVAVKRLSLSSMQGYKEFQSEAQLLMIVHHRNLVSLVGYCDEDEVKALIYEYMVNGNLQQHLS
ncbi:receptor-like protein kinase, partial [Trifolium pratense]